MKIGFGRLPRGRRAVLLLGGMLIAGPAFAQEAQGVDGGGQSVADQVALEPSAEENGDIVVTALKRKTTVQETPIAITAVTGAALANANITDTYQLTRVVPGLVIRESANGGARVTLRNIQAAGEPTVGLYYDEVPLVGPVGVNNDAGGSNPDVRLFDVERVEALRGPQGTLYGSASMAGTVRLIFAKPNLTDYAGAFEGRLTTIDGGGVGYEANAMVNAPIASDLIGMRFVGFYRHRGGWIDNSLRGLQDINDSESYGGRAMLRIRPSSDLTIDAQAYIQRYDGFVNNWLYGTTAGALATKYDARWPTNHRNSDDLDLFSASANYDLGFASLVGTISHQRRFLSYTSDASEFFVLNQANAARCRTYFSLASTATCSATQLEQYRTYALSQTPSAAFSEQETKSDTQELRLSSDGRTAFNWTLGVFHSDRNADIHSDVTLSDAASGEVIFPQTVVPRIANGVVVAPATVIFRRTIQDRLEQTAGYVDASYDITPALSVTAGARYYDYSKTVTGQGVIGNIIIGSGTAPRATSIASDNGWVFKFGANLKLTRDVLLYGTASQGFRPGGVNQVIGLPDAYGPYSSDSLWNYEAGIKTSWFDRALTFNLDVYQIDWSNIQISGQTNAQSTGSTFSFISNAGDARIRGIEVEAAASPWRGLSLRASGSYNDAKLTTDQVSAILTASGKKGDAVPNVPRWTAQGSVEYVQPVGDGLQVSGQVNAGYTGPTWNTFAHTNRYLQFLPGYTEVGARIGLDREAGGWSIALFGNNLLNNVGLTSKGTGTLFGTGNIRSISLMPRTLGLELRKKF